MNNRSINLSPLPASAFARGIAVSAAGSDRPWSRRLHVSFLTAHEDEYSFALVPNWDGSGAVALTPAVVDLADRILVEHALGAQPPVEIAPGKDGSLSFVWDDGRGNYVYLDVGPNETVHLYYDTVAHGKWERVSTASDSDLLARLEHALDFAWPMRQRLYGTFAAPANSNVRGLPVVV